MARSINGKTIIPRPEPQEATPTAMGLFSSKYREVVIIPDTNIRQKPKPGKI